MAEDKTKELIERLEKGIKDTLTSERYQEFLRVQSQFHAYSFNNIMLIYLQRPDATKVAGFKTWEKFDRHVKRGEHGIGILAPSPYKYDIWIDKVDPKTGEPIKDQNGKVIKVKAPQEGLCFVKVSVFDITQTEGKELPAICNELKGNSIQAQNIIKAIRQIAEIPIIEEKIKGGSKGYFDRERNIIAVKEGMAFDQTAKTLVHEYAHSVVHKVPNPEFDRATKEVQAESIAYVVSNHFGLDTSAYSFDYVANWSSGRELPELKKSFELIQKMANDFINKMEDTLNKLIALEKDPVNIERNVQQQPKTEPVISSSIRDKIIGQYSQEFPAIKHITENTARMIDEINSQRDKPLTIRGLKQSYTVTGKKLEQGNPSADDIKTFNTLKEVIDDLKHVQLIQRGEELNQNATQTQQVIPKSMEIDMSR